MVTHKEKPLNGNGVLRSANGTLLPGTVLNPNGRPKGSKNNLSVLEGDELDRLALKRLKEALKDDSLSPSIRYKYVELALGYSRGKPRQTLEHTGEGGQPLSVIVNFHGQDKPGINFPLGLAPA